MTPDEITDEDSLMTWLDGQTREMAVTIAYRAAMRVSALLWAKIPPVSRQVNLTVPMAAMTLLSVSVWARREKREIADAVEAFRSTRLGLAIDDAATSFGHLDATPEFFYPANSINSAAFAVSNNITGDKVASAARRTAEAANAAARSTGATKDLWRAIRGDALLGASIGSSHAAMLMPLWYDEEDPFAAERTKVLEAWRTEAKSDPAWTFWIDWYEAVLEGRPLLGDWDRHWNLLTDIALIDPDKWDAGPDTVNPLIAGIWESHQKLGAVLDATPNGEDLLLTVEDGKIAAVPHADIGDDLRSHILRSVEKALERFFAATSQTGNSNFGPVLRDCAAQDLEYLREDVEQNQAYDVGLHDAIDECLGALRRKFAEQGLSDDPAALRLTTVLERCTVDIYANSEAAREVLEKRADELYRRISLEHSLQLNQLVHDMAADCVEPLARALLADLQRADDVTADPDLRSRSRYRTISRLPRGARAVRYSRFEDGKRVVEDRPQPSRNRLWVATVLGPPGAVLLQHLLSL